LYRSPRAHQQTVQIDFCQADRATCVASKSILLFTRSSLGTISIPISSAHINRAEVWQCCSDEQIGLGH
jgi:hypothetical protein